MATLYKYTINTTSKTGRIKRYEGNGIDAPSAKAEAEAKFAVAGEMSTVDSVSATVTLTGADLPGYTPNGSAGEDAVWVLTKGVSKVNVRVSNVLDSLKANLTPGSRDRSLDLTNAQVKAVASTHTDASGAGGYTLDKAYFVE